MLAAPCGDIRQAAWATTPTRALIPADPRSRKAPECVSRGKDPREQARVAPSAAFWRGASGSLVGMRTRPESLGWPLDLPALTRISHQLRVPFELKHSHQSRGHWSRDISRTLCQWPKCVYSAASRALVLLALNALPCS
jgi:hypothetical protein